MAASAFTLFNKSKLNIANATNLLAQTANWKLGLLSSAWTPDTSDTGNEIWGNISANEIANGNGYTTGGVALTGVALTMTGGVLKFTCTSPLVWTASGSGIPAWRYAALYNTGTLNSKVAPLLAYFLGDTTPANIPLTTAGNTLSININANGIITIT